MITNPDDMFSTGPLDRPIRFGKHAVPLSMAERQAKAAKRKPKKGTEIPKAESLLEATFLLQLRAYNIPTPDQQYMFAREVYGRDWRWDFSWNAERIAVEIQGGQWQADSGHKTGKGMNNDCEKACHGQMLGWVVIHLTGDQVKNGTGIAWVRKILALYGVESHE